MYNPLQDQCINNSRQRVLTLFHTNLMALLVTFQKRLVTPVQTNPKVFSWESQLWDENGNFLGWIENK